MEEQEQNPYSAPSVTDTAIGQSDASFVHVDTLTKFRQQIVALGAFWIFIGCMAATVVLIPLLSHPRPVDINMEPVDDLVPVFVYLIGGMFALLWVTIGTLTCMKILPAVYTGLVLSYLALAL